MLRAEFLQKTGVASIPALDGLYCPYVTGVGDFPAVSAAAVDSDFSH
jgi:glycerol kinase